MRSSLSWQFMVCGGYTHVDGSNLYCPAPFFPWCVLLPPRFCHLHQAFPTCTGQQPLTLTPSSVPVCGTSPFSHTPCNTPSHLLPLHTPHSVLSSAAFPALPPTSHCNALILLIPRLVAPLPLPFWGPLHTPVLISPQHVMQYVLNKPMNWNTMQQIKRTRRCCMYGHGMMPKKYILVSPLKYLSPSSSLQRQSLFLVSYSRNVRCIN